MATCRANVKDRFYALLNAILFCDVNKRFKIYIYIVLVLSPCIVNEYVNVGDVRQLVCISYITDIMCIILVFYGSFISVNAINNVPFVKKDLIKIR